MNELEKLSHHVIVAMSTAHAERTLLSPEISPKIEQLKSKPARRISSYESLFYPNQQHMHAVENGMLYLPAVFACAFIFGISVTKTARLMCFPHNRTEGVYLLSGYICVCLPVFPCFLSPPRWQSDFTDTHWHPPTLQDNCAGWNKALPLPCTTACMHSLPKLKWEFEEPDVNLSSELPPPHYLQVFFFLLSPLLSPSAAFRNTQRWKDEMVKPGSSIRKFIRHCRLLACHVYEGLFAPFHLHTSCLQASVIIQCSVKVNSWHLIPTSWCFISCLFRESKNPAGCTNVQVVQFRQVWTDTSQGVFWLKPFHFVILDFLVMDGSNARSSQTTILPERPSHHERR